MSIVSVYISISGEAVVILADSEGHIWEKRGENNMEFPSEESLEVIYGV